MIHLRLTSACAFDAKENTTQGWALTLQVWRVVFEWWVTWR